MVAVARRYQKSHVIRQLRHVDHRVGSGRHFLVALAGKRNHRTAACLRFLQVSHHLVEDGAARQEENRQRIGLSADSGAKSEGAARWRPIPLFGFGTMR
jgi:hypothetical protein